MVHVGFMLAWKSIRHDLMNAVGSLKEQYPDAALFVSGHSLGGALATLAALDL
jgi:triacylglycerol lipase